MDLLQKYSSKILNAPYLAVLYHPEFTQVDGLYFLSAHLSDDSLSRWLENPKYRHSPRKLENTINHVHLDELIENQETQYEIGVVLKQRWLEKLAQEFPDQEFEVNIRPLQDGGWELQMWAKRDDENTAKTEAG